MKELSEEYFALMKQFDITNRDLAKEAGTCDSSVKKWKDGKKIRHETRVALTLGVKALAKKRRLQLEGSEG